MILSLIITGVISALWYYFTIVIPIRNEQKAASKETEGPIDFNEADKYFIPVEKNQLN